MSAVRKADIVIAGAGIAGLALATALARIGYRIVLLEAGERPDAVNADAGLDDWDRRVSALTPSTQALLEELEVWPRMDAQRLGPYTDMVVWDAEGTGEIAFHAQDAGVSALGHIVENRVTVTALLAEAEASPGVTLQWGDPVAEIAVADHGSPLLTCASGAQWLGSLLVGADGARSKVRELTDFEIRSWSYGQRAIVATLQLADSHRQTCWQAFLPTGPVALLPLAQDNFCSLVWSLDDEAAERWIDADEAQFCKGLGAVFAHQGLDIVASSARGVFPLQQCHAVDYVQPGIALVADAAHSIHPLAGQGINLGLADVKVLAEELERAHRLSLSPGDMRVLQRYQRRRKSENLAMMTAMEAFKRGFGSDHPFVRIARNAGLDWVNRWTPLKQWFVRQALG